MNLLHQVNTPEQAIEFDRLGLTTKDCLYAWTIRYQEDIHPDSGPNYAFRTAKLYYKVPNISKGILVLTDIKHVIYRFEKGQTTASFSGPAFTTAELGKIIGSNIKDYEFRTWADDPTWGWEVNGEFVHHDSEAECRASMLLNIMEYEGMSAGRILANLLYDDATH